MHNTYSDSYPTQQSKAMYNEGFQKVGAGMMVKYTDTSWKTRKFILKVIIKKSHKKVTNKIIGAFSAKVFT